MLFKCSDLRINQVTNRGSALHIAAKSGKLDLVHLLLLNKADV